MVRREREVGLRNPCPELNAIALADSRDILNRVDAVADSEQIGVLSRPADEQIVSAPSFEHVHSRTAL